jgi:hypothetical protein
MTPLPNACPRCGGGRLRPLAQRHDVAEVPAGRPEPRGPERWEYQTHYYGCDDCGHAWGVMRLSLGR